MLSWSVASSCAATSCSTSLSSPLVVNLFDSVRFSHDKLVKIHCLFTHNVQLSIRNHGRWAGVQGLEGLFGVFKKMTTNGKLLGAQIMRKHGSLLWSGRWVTSGSPAAKAVQKLIDGNDEETRRAGNVPCSQLPSFVESSTQRFCSREHIPFGEGCFVKWAQLTSRVDDGGAERGGLKLYAAPMWFGRPMFDFLLQDQSYYLVQGLFQSGDRTICAAKELQELSEPPFSYLMPVLRLPAAAKVVCFVLDKDEATICQMVPHLRSLADEDLRSAFDVEGWPAFSPDDLVFHHNIFVTYGPMRFPDERRWMNGQ